MNDESALTTIVTSTSLDLAISAWLDVKFHKSTSMKTRKAYEDTITQFRAGLEREGLDLDSDRAQVSLLAQAFAGFSARGKQVKGATFNHRLAVLSSFYSYAKKRDLVEHNPMEWIDRAKVQAYAGVQPLDQDDVINDLRMIDRSTPDGARDYALLAIYLEMGWRCSEVAGLCWGNVTLRNGRATITAEHAKGNEQIINTLSKASTEALILWLHKWYGVDLASLDKNVPLWVSLANDGSRGKQLGKLSIANICKKYLGTSKVHATRHTAAHLWEKAGMPVSEIQRRLNHKNIATTSIYLQTLKQAENKYADTIAAMLGIE